MRGPKAQTSLRISVVSPNISLHREREIEREGEGGRKRERDIVGPALSFNALIIRILRIACTITFHCRETGLSRWERADLLALVCDVSLCFCHFPMVCPGSGVVLDCIDS